MNNNQKEKIKKIVRKKILEIGIPIHFLGFKYLEYILSEKYEQAFTCKIYYDVAEHFKTTRNRVERNSIYL